MTVRMTRSHTPLLILVLDAYIFEIGGTCDHILRSPRSALATMCRGFLYPPASAKIDPGWYPQGHPSSGWTEKPRSAPNAGRGFFIMNCPTLSRVFVWR